MLILKSFFIFRNLKLFLGDKSGAQTEENTSHNETAAMTQLEYDLSPSAIAGLFEPDAAEFEDFKDTRVHCKPISQAWTPAGDLLIGCQQGQLLKVWEDRLKLL